LLAAGDGQLKVEDTQLITIDSELISMVTIFYNQSNHIANQASGGSVSRHSEVALAFFYCVCCSLLVCLVGFVGFVGSVGFVWFLLLLLLSCVDYSGFPLLPSPLSPKQDASACTMHGS